MTASRPQLSGELVTYWTDRVRYWKCMVALSLVLTLGSAVAATLVPLVLAVVFVLSAFGYGWTVFLALDGLLFAHKCLVEAMRNV